MIKSYKINASLFPEKNDLIEIINKIELIQWNIAKSTWILKILFNDYCLECDCSECVTVFHKSRTISTFGAEYEYF